MRYSYTIAGAFKDDYIPWSREDLEKIIKTLGLSPRYTQTLAAEHTIFATFPSQNTGKQTCGLCENNTPTMPTIRRALIDGQLIYLLRVSIFYLFGLWQPLMTLPPR